MAEPPAHEESAPVLELASLIRESLLSRAASLEAEFRRLVARDYPSPGPKALLDFCAAACDHIRSSVEAVWHRGETGALTSPRLERSLLRHGQYLIYLHDFLSLIEQTETAETPFELVSHIQYLAKRLVPNTTVIFQSGSQYNYTYLNTTARLKAAFRGPGFSELRKQIPPGLVTFGIPRSEAQNVPLHCVLAHEIGHALYEEGQLADQIGKVSLRLEELQAAAGQPPSPTTIADLTEKVDNWIKELTCDVIGFMLVGIPIILSLADFAGPITSLLDRSGSGSHPPLHLRLTILFEALESSNPGWRYPHSGNISGAGRQRLARHCADAVIERLIKWRRTLALTEPTALDPITTVAYEGVSKTRARLIEVARAAVAELAVDLDQVNNDTSQLVNRLSYLVPPNELSQPNDEFGVRTMGFAEVVNAGWAFSLGQFPGWDHMKWEGDEKKKQLDKLLLKALELIEIRRWVEQANI